MFSGLRGVEAGDEAEVELGSGLSLVKPKEGMHLSCSSWGLSIFTH